MKQPPGPPLMQDEAWQSFHERWSRLRPPLRASTQCVLALNELIAGHDTHILMLGVTPDLAALGQKLTAFDWSRQMIDHIWPGDSDTRQAKLVDWRDIPPQDKLFSAVIGDGSLATAAWPDDYGTIFEQLHHVLAPGAKIVLRCYITPDRGETLAQIRHDTLAGRAENFHALKWRLAMSLASATGDPNIAVPDILRAFNECFADREELAEATGWSNFEISEIDAYASTEAVYSFVTRSQLRDSIPDYFKNIHFVETEGYDLAERCPFLVMEFNP